MFHLTRYTLLMGIDVSYFKIASKSELRNSIACLGELNYYLVVGDEGRDNKLLINLAQRLEHPIIRVFQYPDKSKELRLQREIIKNKLGKKLLILKNVSYQELKFLYYHSLAYLGIAHSEYQPAGWTVACEAIASGTRVILANGCVYQELKRVLVTLKY